MSVPRGSVGRLGHNPLEECPLCFLRMFDNEPTTEFKMREYDPGVIAHESCVEFFWSSRTYPLLEVD